MKKYGQPFFEFLIFTDINNVDEEEQKYLSFEVKNITWRCLALDINGFSDQCFFNNTFTKRII